MQQLLYAAHNVLDETDTGYLLLQILRSFLVIDTLLSFEVHTEETIAMVEEEQYHLGDLIKVCDSQGINNSY